MHFHYVVRCWSYAVRCYWHFALLSLVTGCERKGTREWRATIGSRTCCDFSPSLSFSRALSLSRPLSHFLVLSFSLFLFLSVVLSLPLPTHFLYVTLSFAISPSSFFSLSLSLSLFLFDPLARDRDLVAATVLSRFQGVAETRTSFLCIYF